MEYHHQLKDVILQMNTLKITPKYILNDTDYDNDNNYKININYESFENIIIGLSEQTINKLYDIVLSNQLSELTIINFNTNFNTNSENLWNFFKIYQYAINGLLLSENNNNVIPDRFINILESNEFIKNCYHHLTELYSFCCWDSNNEIYNYMNSYTKNILINIKKLINISLKLIKNKNNIRELSNIEIYQILKYINNITLSAIYIIFKYPLN